MRSSLGPCRIDNPPSSVKRAAYHVVRLQHTSHSPARQTPVQWAGMEEPGRLRRWSVVRLLFMGGRRGSKTDGDRITTAATAAMHGFVLLCHNSHVNSIYIVMPRELACDGWCSHLATRMW